MRSLVNRKINQEPVRSPSPDIANRNIIFHTTAPEVKAILSKSRTKMPEPSKFSFNNSNEDFSNRLSELQENYRRLEAELNGLLFQNSAFKKENSAMKKENAELKDLLAKNKLGFLRLVDQPQPENNFKEYEMRISRFSSEIKRIQELLIRQKQKNQLLESQILKFKNYEQRYSKPLFQSDLHTSSFKFIEESLNGNFERLKAEQELKLHLSLNSLNQRLKEIEKIQITIKSRAYKQNEYQTPKGKKYVQKQDYSTGSDYLAGSIELKKFQRSGRHPQDEREIDFLKDKLRLNQFQLEDAKRENIRLKQQLTKGQERASGAEECAQCKIYIDRIGQLQREIVRFNLITGENKGNQYRGDEILTKNEEERNRNELNSFYINKIQILQRENQALRLLREQEAIESQSRAIHEQEKRSISLTLEDYLGRIKDLKSILSSQQFKDFLSKINVLIDENSNFRAKAVKLDQLNRANRQAKDKQIQLRRLVAQLKRQNGVLKAEVEQTKEQTAKLNEIIDQQIKYQQSKNHFSINEQQLQSVQPDTAKFQRSLYQAVERLQSIQKSISNQISHKEIA